MDSSIRSWVVFVFPDPVQRKQSALSCESSRIVQWCHLGIPRDFHTEGLYIVHVAGTTVRLGFIVPGAGLSLLRTIPKQCGIFRMHGRRAHCVIDSTWGSLSKTRLVMHCCLADMHSIEVPSQMAQLSFR